MSVEQKKFENREELVGFDYRIVEYEKIHQIKQEQFDKLVETIDPKPGDVILDGMDGYGAVSREILKRTERSGFKPEIYTIDESKTQIERERANIPEIDEQHITQGDIRETGFPSGKFDSVAIKMGIHELPKEEQPRIFSEVHRILKPKGKFVVWDLALNERNQKVFQDIIRKKDELAGFNKLVQDRYFPRYNELGKLFEDAGFDDVRSYKFPYEFSTYTRRDELVSKDRKQLLDQKGVLTKEGEERLRQLGEQRAKILADYARERIPEDMREEMKFKDLENDVRFQVEKVIMSGRSKK